MKEREDKIIEILKKTENDIQEVIIEAAKGGDYRSVDMARATAVSIKNLRSQISNPVSNEDKRKKKDKPQIRRKKLSRKTKKSDYPQFIVKNDTLLRIGWSKKQKREYTHKVPRYVFDKTNKSMFVLAHSGNGPFLAEQIIEQINNNESEAIPSYQVYVVVGMLRETNFIKQVGRDGYIIPQDIVEKAEEKWKELSNRRN